MPDFWKILGGVVTVLGVLVPLLLHLDGKTGERMDDLRDEIGEVETRLADRIGEVDARAEGRDKDASAKLDALIVEVSELRGELRGRELIGGSE